MCLIFGIFFESMCVVINDMLTAVKIVLPTIDQLAMANSVLWYGHVLRREDGHVLRMAFDFEVEG